MRSDGIFQCGVGYVGITCIACLGHHVTPLWCGIERLVSAHGRVQLCLEKTTISDHTLYHVNELRDIKLISSAKLS